MRALFLAIALLAALFEPRESWPYLLEEFSPGTVRTAGGTVLSEGLYNISVVDGSLHYVNDGTILAADMRQVMMLKMADKLYVNRLGRMMEVLQEETGGYYLIRDVAVDLEQLAKADIGYGVSSATASTQRLSSFGMEGQGTVNMNLTTAISNAQAGAVLPLVEKIYFLLGSRQVEASRAEFLAIPGLDKTDAKAFLKAEKIKFGRMEDLVKVLQYLKEHNIH